MTPLFSDPLWGGLSLVPRIKVCFSFLYFLVDSLIAGVRKTQEDTLNAFISIVFSIQNKEHKGEIDCETQTNIKYIYIYPSGD